MIHLIKQSSTCFMITNLCLDPILHHFCDGFHDFVVRRLLDQPDKNLTNETLPHFHAHDSHTILHQVEAEDEQLTGN